MSKSSEVSPKSAPPSDSKAANGHDSRVDDLTIPENLRREPSSTPASTAPAKPALIMPRRDKLQAIAREVSELHGEVSTSLIFLKPKIIRIAELLMQAKKILGHGKYIPWIKPNCGFGEREAQRYTRCLKKGSGIVIDAESNATRVSHSISLRAAEKKLSRPRGASPSRKTLQIAPPKHEPTEERNEQLKALLGAWDAADAVVRHDFVIDHGADIEYARNYRP